MTRRGILFFCFFLLLSLLSAPAQSADIQFQMAFSPRGKTLQLMLNTVKDAQESIYVAAFSFTSKAIAEALLEAHKRGVKVRVVADKKVNGNQYTAVAFLANQGVPVRLNGKYAVMHNKFMVVDGKHVQTGSFNYNAAAVNKNAENILVVRNMPALAVPYAAEWQRLWDEGEEAKPNYERKDRSNRRQTEV